MLCPNCKTENDEAANFCTNCRTNLKETTTPEPVAEAPAAEPIAEPVTPVVAPVTPVAEPVTPVATPTAPVAAPAASSEKPNFIATMIGVCLKPMTTFKENLSKFANPKNASIITLIVVAAMTILSTITTVVGVVYSKECTKNCSSFSSLFSDDDDRDPVYETKWEWKRLDKFDWFKSVGQTFLMNMFAVAILSGAYFGMSKAFKSKTSNIWRMVTVVALGSIPATVTTFLSPMLGGINLTFGAIVGMAGALYSLAIILIGLNEESGVEGDKKVYMNIAAAACMALAYYIILRITLGDNASDLLDTYLKLGGSSSVNIDLNSFKF